MIAKFENLSLTDQRRISAHKYENLLNLPHWHMEYELIFPDCGTARVMVGSEQYLLEEGSCIFVSSGVVHNIQSASDSIISVIKTDRELVDSAFDGKTPDCPLIRTQLPLKTLFDEIISALQSSQPYSDIFSSCSMLRILAQLFNGCSMQSRHAVSSGEKYKALLKLIETRYADITFEEAAAFMCYSKPYFSKYFSRISGMSFSAYVNIIRIAEAVSMLSQKQMTITEIAHATGFGTIRHFNRTFKELTGHTPSSLPDDYVFIRYRGSETAEGFDPTLSAPAIL
ncbi:MAG: helix-turn-helix transcriptional regulator [Ruminococcus sp.]|nr:helix-turn-helix transcriptional regulator [Ruminococcus sp.]